MIETAKHRLVLFIKELGLGQSKFESIVGLSNGYVSKLKSSPSTEIVKKIVSKYPQLNTEWLLTGEGEMIKEDLEIKPYEPANEPFLMIPVINLDSVGGIHSQNDILTPEFVERYIPMTGARKGDVAIYQSGNSMSPAIPSGALLHIREVEGWREYLGYGDVFVLLLADERRITKEIRRYEEDPKNYFWCVSYNPDVANEELPKSYVRRVWKVLNVLVNKGW